MAAWRADACLRSLGFRAHGDDQVAGNFNVAPITFLLKNHGKRIECDVILDVKRNVSCIAKADHARQFLYVIRGLWAWAGFMEMKELQHGVSEQDKADIKHFLLARLEIAYPWPAWVEPLLQGLNLFLLKECVVKGLAIKRIAPERYSPPEDFSVNLDRLRHVIDRDAKVLNALQVVTQARSPLSMVMHGWNER